MNGGESVNVELNVEESQMCLSMTILDKQIRIGRETL